MSVASAFKNSRSVIKFLDDLSHYLAIAVAFFIPLSTTLTDICFNSAVALTLLTKNWEEKWKAIKASRISFYFFALFILFILGIFYTSAPLKDISETLLKYTRLVFAIFLIPLFVEEKWRKYAIYAFLAAMILTLFISYAKYFMWSDKHSDVSVFKDHIQQNFLMAFSCYFLALLLIKHRTYRWLIGSLLVLAVYNTLFLSEGRSGYVVLIALMLLFVWQMFRGKGLIVGAFAAFLLLGTAFLFSSAFSARMNAISYEFQEYIQGHRETSVGLRMSYAFTSLELIKKHPFIGTGTGSFQTEYNKSIPQIKEQTKNPHNEYFNIMIQLGSLGLMLLLTIFYVTWHYSRYLPKDYKYVAQALTVVMMLGSLINSWLMDTTEGHFYVYFMALCFASFHKMKDFDLSKSTSDIDNKIPLHLKMQE